MFKSTTDAVNFGSDRIKNIRTLLEGIENFPIFSEKDCRDFANIQLALTGIYLRNGVNLPDIE